MLGRTSAAAGASLHCPPPQKLDAGAAAPSTLLPKRDSALVSLCYGFQIWKGPVGSSNPTLSFSDKETETQRGEKDFPGRSGEQEAELGSEPRIRPGEAGGMEVVFVATRGYHTHTDTLLPQGGQASHAPK